MVGKYEKAIKPFIERFKEQIKNSSSGEIEIKLKDIAKIMGKEFEDKHIVTVYSRLKDVLLEHGIKVVMNHHYGCNLVMSFADKNEIMSAADARYKRGIATAEKQGYSNWNEYQRNLTSYQDTKQTNMREDEENKFYFVNIGKKYIAPVLFPGAVINKESLGPGTISGGYDWTTSDGIKIKHIASHLKHRIYPDLNERDVFEWLIGKNEVADAFLLTGWGKVGNLELMKAWIFNREDIVNDREFWNRMSFVISTHKRSILKYSKYEVNQKRLDTIRKKLIDLIIPEVKISDEERKEIHDILEEMESGKEYRLEDVRIELNVSHEENL